MAVLLVTYDLNNETRRPPVLDLLRRLYPDNVRLSESSYAIDTLDSPGQVHESFKYLLDEDDNFLVVTLHQPCAGWVRKPTVTWLDTHLKHCP